MNAIPKLAVLLIGSNLDDLAAVFRVMRAARPWIHEGYDMPPEELLVTIDYALVFELDQRARFEQLRYLSRQRRANGYLKAIIGYSHKLDVSLAAAVEATGARFVPLPGVGR